MIASILNHKMQILLTFLGSFSVGMAFIESHPVLGNFIGSAIMTLAIGIIKNIKKRKRNVKR